MPLSPIVGWLLLLGVWAPLRAPAADRVSSARTHHQAALRAELSARKLSYPPARVLLRAFKTEGELEVWVGGSRGPLQRLWTLPICAASGTIGPKREVGDGQVPEGIYRVARFNPFSQFHLSLGIDYPNAADRRRGASGGRAAPPDLGGDIFIHGGCATIGCLPLGDQAIERLYLLAADAHAQGTTIAVHLLPARLDEAGWARLGSEVAPGDPRWALWRQLREVDQAFAAHRRIPEVEIDAAGRYRVRPGS